MKIEDAMAEYHDARIKIVKSIRKMNYRIKELDEKKMGLLLFRYFGQKGVVLKELRRMDKLLRQIRGVV